MMMVNVKQFSSPKVWDVNVILAVQFQPNLRSSSLQLVFVYCLDSLSGMDYAKDEPLKILNPGLFGLTDLRDIIPFLRFLTGMTPCCVMIKETECYN